MKDQLTLLPGLFAAHLRLTLLALLIGVCASIPLGIWASRRPNAERVVLGIAGILQTVPSLALLAVLVPLLAWAGLGGIGFTPALIGLVLYSVLPVLRNTVTGIKSVDPAMVEAAQGVGMTEREMLFRVQIPLALPHIVAGVRTAAVWTVGTATLATPVGAQSLGNFIFSGLQTRNLHAVWIGSAAAAVLAITLDTLVHLVETGLKTRRRARVHMGAVAFVLLAVASVAPLFQASTQSGGAAHVRVGAKTFTEQYILANVLARTAERAGSTAETVESLGSTVAFDALAAGRIDVYTDYSGTIWATILKRGDPPTDRKAVLAEVKRALLAEHGIEVIAALGFENTYAFAMRSADADRLHIRSLADLSARSAELRIGSDYEFFQRAEWKSLTNVYAFKFAQQTSMDSSLMYEAVRTAQVDVITAFSTDGRIAAYNLVLLDDNRQVIPPYEAIVLLRPGFRASFPRVAQQFEALENAISTAEMQRLNGLVDETKQSPRTVAEEFLRSRGTK